ncbi:hypothetical protein ACLOJK_017488 [Asimina triloba]
MASLVLLLGALMRGPTDHLSRAEKIEERNRESSQNRIEGEANSAMVKQTTKEIGGYLEGFGNFAGSEEDQAWKITKYCSWP